MRVFVTCDSGKVGVTMTRADDSEITDDAMLAVLTTDFLATGGDDVLTAIIPEDGFPIDTDMPLVREVIADWMRQRGGSLHADTFSDADNPVWNISEACTR